MKDEDNKVLDELANKLSEKYIYCTKEVLTADETAKYCGFTKSYLYQLTMKKQIPYSKPFGKMCFFNRHELEQWLQRKRFAAVDEVQDKAESYCRKNPIKRTKRERATV